MSDEANDVQASGLSPVDVTDVVMGMLPVIEAGQFTLYRLRDGRPYLRRGVAEGMEIKPKVMERVLRDLWEVGF